MCKSWRILPGCCFFSWNKKQPQLPKKCIIPSLVEEQFVDVYIRNIRDLVQSCLPVLFWLEFSFLELSNQSNHIIIHCSLHCLTQDTPFCSYYMIRISLCGRTVSWSSMSLLWRQRCWLVIAELCGQPCLGGHKSQHGPFGVCLTPRSYKHKDSK